MIGYTEFRDTLKVELTDRLRAIEYTENRLDTYDKNNWAFRQAHKNGQRSTIQGILKLIDHLDQKESTTNDRQPISEPGPIITGPPTNRSQQEVP